MKMNFTRFFTVFLMGLSLSSIASDCNSVKTCLDLTAKLTDTTYSTKEPLKGNVTLSSDFKITRKNADHFMSETLFQHGYARVKGTSNSWTIINARDMRYYPTEIVTDIAKLPNNLDYFLYSTPLKNKFIGHDIVRNMRPFMSRYGRIIDIKAPANILIHDTAKNIKRLKSIIDALDIAPTAAQLKTYKKSKKFKEKMSLIQAQSCNSKK